LASSVELSQAQLNRTEAEIRNLSAKYDYQSQYSGASIYDRPIAMMAIATRLAALVCFSSALSFADSWSGALVNSKCWTVLLAERKNENLRSGAAEWNKLSVG
jgi:hypothetical protein